MTMNSRAKLNHSLLYIALLTLTFSLAACGDAADAELLDEFAPSGDSDKTNATPGADILDRRDPDAKSDAASPGETTDDDKSVQLEPAEKERPDHDTSSNEADQTEPEDSAETPETEPEDSAESPATEVEDSTDFLSRSDTRAMWVWNENPTAQQLLENDAGAQDELFSFLSAPHQQPERSINRLFFEARGYANGDRFENVRTASFDPINTPGDQQNLRDFLARAHAQGVAVEYLDGQAIWVASDANAQAPKDICSDVIAFNLSSTDAAQKFDGIHLDIEPHTVQSGPFAGVWWENRLPGGYNAEWTARWKDILNSCRQTIDAYTADTGHSMTLSSDIGTDYAHYNAPILEFLNRGDGPVDYLTIMNYFDNRPNTNGDPSYFNGDNAEGEVIGGVIQNLEAWDQLPLLFALETGPESIAPDAQSFFQEGYAALYATVDALLEQFGSDRTLGVGFHHYSPESYRDLTP